MSSFCSVLAAFRIMVLIAPLGSPPYPSPRAPSYSEDTERFDAFTSKLNTEIAIRNDFATLALEAVSAMPGPELQASFASWVDNNGFVGSITTEPRLCSVENVKPLRLQLLKGGVVGMLDLPTVQEYYEKVCMLGMLSVHMREIWDESVSSDLARVSSSEWASTGVGVHGGKSVNRNECACMVIKST